MFFASRLKAGYTLVEVLVVVSIIGVLSTMGVAGLQRAVANSRIKDAAVNTAAFVERVANLSIQRDEVLCIKVAPGSGNRKLIIIRDTTTRNCNAPNGGTIDSLIIDSPVEYESPNEHCPAMHDWANQSTSPEYKIFKPKRGLAATPPEGGICIKYGSMDVYGAVRKEKRLNKVVPMWKVGDDNTQNSNWNNWTEL